MSRFQPFPAPAGALKCDPTWPTDIAEPRTGGAFRWTGSAAAVLVLHGAVAFAILPAAAPPTAPAAPEAAVLIDLPADLALPPMESVESLAAPEIEATASPETAEIPPTDAPPVEPPADLVPAQTLQTAESETLPTVEAEAERAEAVALPPEETSAAVQIAAAQTAAPAPPDLVQAVEAEVVEPTAAVEETPVSEPPVTEAVADARPEEVAVAEAIAPVPPAIPPRRPPRPVAEQVERAEPVPRKPRRETAEAPASARPSKAAVDGQRASGAGRPDPDALSHYMSVVRRDIMRQRRGVRLDGRGRTAVVSFTIGPSGSLNGVRIAASSGNPELDAAAVAMVRRASPVPARPTTLGGDPIPARLPVRFD